MTAGWEYMVLIWRQKTREVGGKPQWRNEFQIRKAGAAVETRVEFDFGEEDEKKIVLLDLLNEFGAEGWEAVTETPLMAAMGSDIEGFREVGAPVEICWLLKRPLRGT